jgi:ribosomal protein L11 methyltransferase
VVVPAAEAEVAMDRLWTSGATGIEERDSEPSSGWLTMLAGFPTPEAAQSVAAQLTDLGADVVEVDDRSQDAWKQYAEPTEVESLVVVPAWRPVPIDGRLIVTIDPGRSFGSGSHATTRLLLAQLVRRVMPGSGVFDVGTGSGILAVAAARLGAGRVVAVDIDPEAVEVAQANAAANGVADRVEVSSASVEVVPGPFDLVVVNLTAAVLASLAGALVAAVAPGGVLLMSGMLPGQWEHIANRFVGLQVIEMPVLDGWLGAVLGRP